MSERRIAVLGSGANGSSVGADLIRAGHDVVLVEQWPEHVTAMRHDGLRIEMPGETVTVRPEVYHLCEVATFRRRFDVVLVLMKAYDTGWACRLIEPYLAPDGLIAGVQNGMTTGTVAEVAGAHRTIGAVIEVSSMMVDPGVVQRHSPPARSWFAVGGVDPATADRAEEVAGLLRAAGTVEVVADIQAAKWMKLVSNCTTLVGTAILGMPMLAAGREPGMRELMVRAGQEALDVGAALGHQRLPIFGLAPADMLAPERIVELLLGTLYAGFVLPETTTTILHDWLKGRHSEVDDINGEVVAHGHLVPGGTPVNAAIVEVAHRIERGDLRPDPANADLLAKLAA